MTLKCYCHHLCCGYLRLIADDNVVLHGMRNVIYRKLQEGPLWNIDQTLACPGGSMIKRVGPRDQCHTLKRHHNNLMRP